MAIRFLLTCEHGGNRVPRPFAPRFAKAAEALESHRGWDPGALVLAKRLAGELKAPLHFSEISRLVIELNRSLGHPRLFSEFTRGLSSEARESLVAEVWRPYRDAVERQIETWIAAGHTVRHLSVHSFTPVFEGVTRACDIGLLYDPRRADELAWTSAWLSAMKARAPDLRLRRNYPYRGTSDGFTTSLRKRFRSNDYVGVEIEVNQKYPLARQRGEGNARTWSSVIDLIVETLPRK